MVIRRCWLSLRRLSDGRHCYQDKEDFTAMNVDFHVQSVPASSELSSLFRFSQCRVEATQGESRKQIDSKSARAIGAYSNGAGTVLASVSF